MTLLVFYILLAIGVSFLCSILEAVLLSVTPSFIEVKENESPVVAARLRMLKDDIDRPLAAILSLNTIAHTVGAAGAGAQAAFVFGDAFLALFSGVLTFLILVLSEIIPKTLGATYWRALASPVSAILPVLIWSMWPLVKMSQGLTRLLSRGKQEAAVSRDEIAAMARVGHQEGVVEESESRVVRNLLRFNALEVRDVMTPRTVVFALPETTLVGAALQHEDGELPFSRIPVFAGSVDDVTGFVLKDDILLAIARDEDDTTLADLKRELPVVSETMKLDDLFERLLEQSDHIALVADEYGGTAGIVTLEDMVETLLGQEIVDEADTTEDMQALARRQADARRTRRAGRAGDAAGDRSRGPSEDGEALEKDAVLQYGITGGSLDSASRSTGKREAAPEPERQDDVPTGASRRDQPGR